MNLYTLIHAATYNAEGDLTAIENIEGSYTSYFAYLAAPKVVTSIYNFLNIPSQEQGPPVVFILQREFDKKLYAYNGWRIPSPQGVRKVTSSDTKRTRTYRWLNKVNPININDVLY